VAPLMTHSGCFGVLASEVRHGREKDEATRAVATIIAAQLSTLVAPWPAPSTVGEQGEPAVSAPAAGQTTTDRTAASA
jgi:hypothetical protein